MTLPTPGAYVLWKGRIPGVPWLCLRVYVLLADLGNGRWRAEREGQTGVIHVAGPGWSLHVADTVETCRAIWRAV